jgi:hypothetical protein
MQHGLRGHCDGETAIIDILMGLDPMETYRTLIHELLHAIEFEYDLHFPHHLIYKLEEPLLAAVVANFISPSSMGD